MIKTFSTLKRWMISKHVEPSGIEVIIKCADPEAKERILTAMREELQGYTFKRASGKPEFPPRAYLHGIKVTIK